MATVAFRYTPAVEMPSPLVINWWLWLALFAFWLIAALFAKRTKSKESQLIRLQHTLPLAAAYYLVFNRHRFFFLTGEIYSTDWNNWIVYPAMALTIVGITFAIYARIHLGRNWSGIITIKEGHKVIQSGPYAIVRHPIYTGWLTAFFGSVLLSGTGDAFLAFELLTLGFLVKLFREEKLLTAELGDEYNQYIRRVPAGLVPFVSSVGGKSEQGIHSDAFDQAALQSDQYRAIGILCVCGAFILLDLVLGIANFAEFARYVVAISWWLAIVMYEGIVLTIARHAQWLKQHVRPWVWAVNTILECCMPTIALLGLTLERTMGPYRALVSSTVLIYFVFIILSTLRLSPILSILSGLASSLGYLVVFLLTLALAPGNKNRGIVPDRTYEMNAVLLFVAGIVAAAVAYQIRRYLISALAEAETRRQLDRVQYDLGTARSIQMALLPKSPPLVAGYEIAGFSQPADQTGGDYYDWIQLPGNQTLFAIADATGHGIGSALLISSCRAYFRALAKPDQPLEQIMARVDALFAADGHEGRFITAAIAMLDPARNSLTLYSAGHAPLFLYVAAKNAMEIYDAQQPPLGIDACDDNSKACSILLSPGDTLVLLTDGFYEYHNNNGEMLGSERLIDAIRAHHTLPPGQLIERLRQTVSDFAAGAAQADDMTAVVIKRC